MPQQDVEGKVWCGPLNHRKFKWTLAAFDRRGGTGAARVDGNQFFRFDHHRNSPPTPTLRMSTAVQIRLAQRTHLDDQENSRSRTARPS